MLCRIVVTAVLSLACCSAAETLRQAAGARGVAIGTAVNPRYFSQTEYATTLAREFDQIQPENAMKMRATQPARDRFDFADGDAIVAFAEQHGMKVRGHTLVWHESLPDWLQKGTFTPPELRDIMLGHIRGEVSHYAGKVYAWDVVNEAVTKDGAMRQDLWNGAPGIGAAGKYGYIEAAFRAAHEADPKALLFYNDYDTEVSNAKSDAIYEMARQLLRDGAPIGGVGFQCHLSAKTTLSREQMTANLRRFADLGLQVQITELDVALPVDAHGVASPENLRLEARLYG